MNGVADIIISHLSWQFICSHVTFFVFNIFSGICEEIRLWLLDYGGQHCCVYPVKRRRRKGGERSSDVAHEEEPDFGGNMASPAGCKHYVRSCLLKVSELF